MSQCAPTPALQRKTAEFLGAVAKSTSVPEEVLGALTTLPPAGAAYVAVVLGSAVEGGIEARSSGSALVALLRQWLAQRPLSESMRAAFPWLGQAVVAHLARDHELRAELAQERPLLEALDDASEETYGALWIHELLLRRSGPLVVLHVESRRGLAMHYQNVGTCFHLFTLVQAAICTRLPGGREPDPEIVEAAMGGPGTSHSDSAWWHYQDARATESHFMSSLWAEWAVDDIREIDGVRVLLLWPPILGARSWDESFFGPALEPAPPQVTLERELERSEVEQYFERIGIAR